MAAPSLTVELYQGNTNDCLLTTEKHEGLNYESVHPGGYARAGVTFRRPITRTYPEFAKGNGVKVIYRGETAWEGFVNKPKLAEPDIITLECLGWSASLKENGETGNVAGMKGSAFLTGVMLAADRCQVVGGTIDTGDYTLPLVDIDTYWDWNRILATYYAFNESWTWGVWNDRRIDWKPLDLSTKYIVPRQFCDGLKVEPESAPYANRIYYTYTVTAGALKRTLYVEDTDAQADYGGRVVSEYIVVPERASAAEAQDLAEAWLELRTSRGARGAITARRVWKEPAQEYHLPLVRAGNAVRVPDYLTVDALLNQLDKVDELTTFTVKNAKYVHESNTVTMTPTEYASGVAVMLARLQEKYK